MMIFVTLKDKDNSYLCKDNNLSNKKSVYNNKNDRFNLKSKTIWNLCKKSKDSKDKNKN